MVLILLGILVMSAAVHTSGRSRPASHPVMIPCSTGLCPVIHWSDDFIRWHRQAVHPHEHSGPPPHDWKFPRRRRRRPAPGLPVRHLGPLRGPDDLG